MIQSSIKATGVNTCVIQTVQDVVVAMSGDYLLPPASKMNIHPTSPCPEREL